MLELFTPFPLNACEKKFIATIVLFFQTLSRNPNEFHVKKIMTTMCEPKLKHAQSVLTPKVLPIVHASHTQTHVLKPNSLTIVKLASPKRCTISTDHKSILNCAYFFLHVIYNDWNHWFCVSCFCTKFE